MCEQSLNSRNETERFLNLVRSRIKLQEPVTPADFLENNQPVRRMDNLKIKMTEMTVGKGNRYEMETEIVFKERERSHYDDEPEKVKTCREELLTCKQVQGEHLISCQSM